MNDYAKAYEKTFALFLLANTPLKEIDDLLFEAGVSEVTEEEKNAWHKNDCLCLRYFYLMTSAKVDNLTTLELETISEIVANPSEDNIMDFLNIIKNTFNDVMCIDPLDKENATCIGPYPDDKFCFDNDSIVIGFSKGAKFTEEGELVDNPIDTKCNKIIENLRDELIPQINEALGCKICLFIE